MVLSRQHMTFNKYGTEFFARRSAEIEQTFFLRFEREKIQIFCNLRLQSFLAKKIFSELLNV
jgi:hypothetical protein